MAGSYLILKFKSPASRSEISQANGFRALRTVATQPFQGTFDSVSAVEVIATLVAASVSVLLAAGLLSDGVDSGASLTQAVRPRPSRHTRVVFRIVMMGDMLGLVGL